ncbi:MULTISPECIES: cytochrome P450 [unclassified Crossiella]|uniref:cytochrome P450 n=1 Tax=unclassified Crossiella TaxID=2620835 RepID=UPI001FFF7C21|nr:MULTISPECIES: cytochrome P450 [unclassified Crossiella]MCK2238040.1 cytochrome P450 [Crossiella sp. S99.2]MCK2255323.1 cytochrome P450 [Crossiella sp. S99.1]
MPPDYPPSRVNPLDPPPRFAHLRAHEPVSLVRTPHGETVWLVTRHADARFVLGDPRFSSDPANPGFPQIRPAPEGPRMPGIFLSMDPPEHGRFRRMLTGEFTVRRMAALRPGIQAVVRDCLAGLLGQGPPADLMACFARPLPALVICDLLGVPFADREFFASRSEIQLDRSRPGHEVTAAMAELWDYLDGLVAGKLAAPGADLISRLAVQRVRTGELTKDDLVGMSRLLLVAGHETTANMIGIGMLLLLRHPALWAELRADPGLLPAAVEELLRHATVVQQGVVRAVLAEVDLGGVRLARGDGVIVSLSSANRDAAVYPEPDELDLHRRAAPHLAFGHGVHQCLGQLLARAELTEAVRALLPVPGLRLAIAPDQVKFRHEMAVYGVRELPVEWH